MKTIRVITEKALVILLCRKCFGEMTFKEYKLKPGYIHIEPRQYLHSCVCGHQTLTDRIYPYEKDHENVINNNPGLTMEGVKDDEVSPD